MRSILVAAVAGAAIFAQTTYCYRPPVLPGSFSLTVIERELAR
jgi:hypothetical protein